MVVEGIKTREGEGRYIIDRRIKIEQPRRFMKKPEQECVSAFPEEKTAADKIDTEQKTFQRKY